MYWTPVLQTFHDGTGSFLINSTYVCVFSPFSISNCRSHLVPLLSLLPPSSLHREVFDFLSQWRISRTSRGSGRSGELPSRQTSHLSCTPLIRVHYLYTLILWFSLTPLSAKLFGACSANESNPTDWLIPMVFFFAPSQHLSSINLWN